MLRYLAPVFFIMLLSVNLFAQTGRGSVPPDTGKAREGPAGSDAEADPESDAEGDASRARGGPFPFVPILETLRRGAVSWRPDWPFFLPQDAFAVNGPLPREIRLILGEEEYALVWDENRRLLECPLLFNGNFCRAVLSYNPQGMVSLLSIQVTETPSVLPFEGPAAPAPLPRAEAPQEGPDQESPKGEGETSRSIEIEFLEYDALEAEFPSLLRINSGEGWFFVVLEYSSLRASETWYDAGGNALAVHSYRYSPDDGTLRFASFQDLLGGEEGMEEYYYDSWGNLNAIENEGGSSPRSSCSALYRSSQPRYWRFSLPEPWRFMLQWDEQGLLAGIKGYRGGEGGEGEADADWDSRYEYTLDEWGNWIERRERIMIRRGDFLIPTPGTTIHRRID
ncbi:MAG: hypothetical protein LBT16_01235 [Treponema sp.]|jgi:hypothetical protein|nr:hypothetical protein [Treponema sp.]